MAVNEDKVMRACGPGSSVAEACLWSPANSQPHTYFAVRMSSVFGINTRRSFE